MTTGSKVLMALCTVVGVASLVSVAQDPSGSPLWGTLIGMVLVAASLHPRVRRLGRRDSDGPK